MALKEYDYGSYELFIVQFWYACYICSTIFSLIITCGTIFLFIYFYRNNFSAIKEDCNRIALQKKEKRKQAKRNRLQKQKDKLQQRLNNLNQ